MHERGRADNDRQIASLQKRQLVNYITSVCVCINSVHTKEELHNFFDQVKRIRWAGHVGHIGQERNVYRVLADKP
jgi:hypothetical protein